MYLIMLSRSSAVVFIYVRYIKNTPKAKGIIFFESDMTFLNLLV